jgi:hypothetical protein
VAGNPLALDGRIVELKLIIVIVIIMIIINFLGGIIEYQEHVDLILTDKSDESLRQAAQLHSAMCCSIESSKMLYTTQMSWLLQQ